MTDAEPTARTGRAAGAVRRLPATLTVLGLVLAAGVVSGGLWSPFEDSPAWDVLAYGLPAFQAGRWWTPLTGTFLVNQPWVYVFTVSGFAGMAYLEWRRGWRRALGYFAGGQLVAVVGAALFLWLAALLPWPWAQTQAAALDVGASGGTMACIAAAAGLLVAPWRVRAWLILLAFSLVAVLFWGELADIEHAIAVILVLAVDRSLRPRRATVREQRLVAFVAVLTIGAVELIVLLVPTSGPFGTSTPVSGSFVDVAIDLIVILLIADGLRRGRRWAWIWALVIATVNVLTIVAIVALAAALGWEQLNVDATSDLSVSLATAALWIPMLVYLIWVRAAFRVRRRSRLGVPPAPAASDVREALRADGGGTLSWMTTWEGNSYARLPSGGIVAYQRRSGVALALADPIAPAAGRAAAVEEFVAAAEHAALIPCFFSADDHTRACVPDGWRSLVVADDTIVDLVGLQFTGKRWNSVRSSLNRADREDMSFRLTTMAEQPWGVRQQLRAISEMWVGDKGLPEMGFTLGTLVEAEDPQVRLALALAPNGDVDGFLSWLPVFGGDGVVRGWTLDLMRRREGGFGPVMEFLIGSSAQRFSDEGAEFLSLSGAPLAHDYPPDAGAIAALSEKLADVLEPVYGFRSLHRFKEKFHPRYETLYLLYRDESDLPPIGAALTRAFLPDATLRQFAGAGLELVRGRGG